VRAAQVELAKERDEAREQIARLQGDRCDVLVAERDAARGPRMIRRDLLEKLCRSLESEYPPAAELHCDAHGYYDGRRLCPACPVAAPVAPLTVAQHIIDDAARDLREWMWSEGRPESDEVPPAEEQFIRSVLVAAGLRVPPLDDDTSEAQP
jgi:hypothetical protein